MPTSPAHSTQVALTSSRVLDTVGVPPKKVWEGIYMASVVSTADPLGQGRVTLYVPQVLGTAVSNWATPLGYGYVEIPPVNAMVHCYFAGGDINQPVYIYVNTNNTSAAALSVGTGAAPQTATTTPAAATGTAPGMTVVPSGQSVTATLITDPTNYQPATILANTASAPGNLSYIRIKGPTNTASGVAQDHVSQIMGSSDTSSNAAYNGFYYVDSTNTTHTNAIHGAQGFIINQGKVTAVQPGTGGSNANPPIAETWHNASTIPSGWTGTARYKLNPDNTVSLGGGLTAPSTGNVTGVTLFQVPSGYIPASERWVPCAVFGTNSSYGGQAQIDTSGNVQLNGVINTLNSYTFLFDGCRYPLD